MMWRLVLFFLLSARVTQACLPHAVKTVGSIRSYPGELRSNSWLSADDKLLRCGQLVY